MTNIICLRTWPAVAIPFGPGNEPRSPKKLRLGTCARSKNSLSKRKKPSIRKDARAHTPLSSGKCQCIRNSFISTSVALSLSHIKTSFHPFKTASTPSKSFWLEFKSRNGKKQSILKARQSALQKVSHPTNARCKCAYFREREREHRLNDWLETTTLEARIIYLEESDPFPLYHIIGRNVRMRAVAG